MKWYEHYDKRPHREECFDGFKIWWWSSSGDESLRYIVGNKAMTLLGERVKGSKMFFIFPSFVLVVTMPARLQWDDGVPLTEEEEKVARYRIQVVLDKWGRNRIETAETPDA